MDPTRDRDSYLTDYRPPERAGGGRLLRMAIAYFAIFAVITAAIGYINRTLPLPTPASLASPPLSAHPTAPRTAAVPPNSLSYQADANGHFYIDANVNGAPIHFLVDTGATFVTLSPEDATAAGILRSQLTFDRPLHTANGLTHGASVTLRDIRLGQMAETEIPAMVMETPEPISLLGMSFLQRFHYDVEDGKLTLYW